MKIDLDDGDNVEILDVTLADVRGDNFWEKYRDSLDLTLDEAQAHVHMGDHAQAFVVIRISK